MSLFVLLEKQQRFNLFLSVSQFSGPNWVATLNAGKGGAHASYYHRANKQVEQIPSHSINRQFTVGLFFWNPLVCVCIHQIQVGVEFEASTRTQETTTSFGYQMELPEANMVFRGKTSSALCLWERIRQSSTDTQATSCGTVLIFKCNLPLMKHSVITLLLCLFAGMINSRCIIGGVLEKRLVPLPATLIMGAFVNHRGDKLQVGLGINVG